MSQSFEQVRAIAADILQVPLDRITPASSEKNIATWDSIQHLNLILALEAAFQIQFEPDEMDSTTTIGRLAETLDRKKLSGNGPQA